MNPSPRLGVAAGIFHPEAGGPATYLYEILPHLQQRGWDVRLLSYGSGPTEGYPYPVTRVERRFLPRRRLGYARAARELLAGCDLLYVHTIDLPLPQGMPRVMKVVGDQAWERCVRRGWVAPTTDVDTFQTARYGPLVSWQRHSRARQVRAMDGVIVPSEYLRRMVLGWGLRPEQVQVVYNALPPAEHAPPATQEQARAQLGLPPGPLLLTAARLTAWKGVDHLLAALAGLPDVTLLVAGDGPELPRLQALAAPLGARVRFLGRVGREQMPLYMKAADYLALYSGYEGLSHTLLESLRDGTPVIASDKGGNPEVVAHGVNGLLVPYVDVAALSAALHEAFAPGRREALAANSGQGMERFRFEYMVQQTDAALRRFLR